MRDGSGNAPRREPVPDGYEGILRRHAVREAAARTYARALPIVPVRARGLTVEGADGRRYLDCASGGGALALGHNHPVVLEAIRGVLDSGAPLHAYDLATPVRDAFVTELLRTLPPGLADHARVRFCGPAGTDAVEAALQLVRAATGRTEILAFAGGQQGVTAVVRQGSGDAFGARAGSLPASHGYRSLPAPDGVYGGELGSLWADFALDAPKSGLLKPAAVILEPVQGNGEVIPVPDDWMRRIRHITATHSTPLIVDESETGVGRTGAFWAVQHSGVTPDVMVLSRAIGGSLPLSVIVHRNDLDVGQPRAYASEFRGNQLAMAAGTATLTYVRENDLAGRAADIGARMLGQLRRFGGEFACVGDVRGWGLMIGVEFVGGEGTGTVAGLGVGAAEAEGAFAGERAVTDQGAFADRVVGPRRRSPSAPPRAAELAAAVQQECLRRGLIVELTGHHANVVRLLPPLTITDEQAAAVIDRLYDAVEAVAGGRTGGSGGGIGG
ncbi:MULTISPECIES: aminotransferase class III-fold pyridoxal phosphate-dependent enzyme [unclassified Streptomyces]|uniref:aminotransferase class III-fold pyridoxal phosphate-dependent enzyme n=1 Tax=unclassified Streptomyces TaxID=2593676 RepID=UPI002E2C6635|nr:aminotransferase class III-fold pyridoxal phosphate-dependent enzyme [Streptomyces sp. NBC_00228]